MRGALQVTFAVDILRIRSTSWRSNHTGLYHSPLHLLRVQIRLNPSRCHRTTVASRMIARMYRHASHRRARTTPQRAALVAEATASIPEGTGEDADLVTERQVLHREVTLRPKGGPGSPEDRPNQAPHPPDAIRATLRGSRVFAQTEYSGGTTRRTVSPACRRRNSSRTSIIVSSRNPIAPSWCTPGCPEGTTSLISVAAR